MTLEDSKKETTSDLYQTRTPTSLLQETILTTSQSQAWSQEMNMGKRRVEMV